jgi:methylmalonyl-CoA mutase
VTASPEVPPDEQRLTSGFAPATRARWRELALGVLRKSGMADDGTTPDDVEGLLATPTYDGLAIGPLYTADDAPGAGSTVRPTRTGAWDVRQHHRHPDPAATAEAVQADLVNGATSIWLGLGDNGAPVPSLDRALLGVHLDLAPVVLDAGAETAAAAEAFLALVGERGTAASGNLGADPLGLYARTGDDPACVPAAELATRCVKDFDGIRALTVDATAYHDAGGSDAEELGCALATGVAYLRTLTEAGLGLEAALGQLEFRYAATADQFATVAKLRAARRTWARVAQACEAPESARGQRQHAVTSTAMAAARDPWVNMLRTTVACFAAGIGGADAVTVQPFDATLGLPDGFARRIARNTQTVLLEESHAAGVADPAGGSWFVERLTEQLAEAAWDWFTAIERAGGMAAALRCGLVSDRLAATWERRRQAIAERRDPLTGVSEFPNLAERLPARSPAPAPRGGGPVPRVRYAADFEALRDRADAHAEATGSHPVVFLATLGPVAAHTARTAYATNLFAAGGIKTLPSGPHTDPDALAAAFTASGTTVACLCSSDAVYAEDAEPVAAALSKAGARTVWLAGPPAAGYGGVGGYLHTGCDAVAALRRTLADLEVR